MAKTHSNRSMRPRIAAILLLLPCLGLHQGCMSVAFQTSLPPRESAHPGLANGARYTITTVRVKKIREGNTHLTPPWGILATSTRETSARQTLGTAGTEFNQTGRNRGQELIEATWRNAILEAAVRRHPRLFSRDNQAIPLAIEIDAKVENTFAYSMVAEICTLGILGGILPLPVSSSGDITVRANRTGSSATPGVMFEFKRADKMWISLSPLATIPYPAASDVPQAVLTMPADLGESAPEAFTITSESVVEGLVRVLEKNQAVFGTQPPPGAASARPEAPRDNPPPTPQNAPTELPCDV